MEKDEGMGRREWRKRNGGGADNAGIGMEGEEGH